MAQVSNMYPVNTGTKPPPSLKIPWYLDRFWRLLAGSGIFLSTLLGVVHHPYWLVVTLLSSGNLFISALTDRCPMKSLLGKLGVKEREEHFLPGGRLKESIAVTRVLGNHPNAKELDHAHR